MYQGVGKVSCREFQISWRVRQEESRMYKCMKEKEDEESVSLHMYIQFENSFVSLCLCQVSLCECEARGCYCRDVHAMVVVLSKRKSSK